MDVNKKLNLFWKGEKIGGGGVSLAGDGGSRGGGWSIGRGLVGSNVVCRG